MNKINQVEEWGPHPTTPGSLRRRPPNLDPRSDLEITSSYRGTIPPADPRGPLDIVERIGIDLNIVDVRNDDQRLWLRSLIWPEHHERRRNLDLAERIVRRSAVRFIEGDAVALLESAADSVRDDAALCVFHTHVAHQMSARQRQDLFRILDGLSEKREIFHLYNNIKPGLHLTSVWKKRRTELPLARTEPHGHWVEWASAGTT